MTSAEDAETVLRAIPGSEHEALAALVRLMRVVAAAEGYFNEDDLFTLYRRQRERNEMLRRCISEHHAVGVMDRALIGDQCPVCEEWLNDDQRGDAR